MAERNDLGRAAVKTGEFLLFIVLLAAGLWTALALVKLSGWWEWLVERGPDGQVAAATLPTLAALLISVAFVHDRILRKAGVRPAEPASVTVRKALRQTAVSGAEGLLFLVLFLPWFALWSVLAMLTGVRAAMYQNMPVSVAVTLTGFVLAGGCAWISHAWITRKLRARRRPPQNTVREMPREE